MGLQYRPIEISVGDVTRFSVGLIDTGADETIISNKLAKELKCRLRGNFTAKSASRGVVQGKYAQLGTINEKWSGKSVTKYRVGVTDDPFADDEGIDIIIGVDFLQDTEYNLKFSNK